MPKQPLSKDAAERAYFLADVDKLRAEVELIRENTAAARYDREQREALASARRVFDIVGEITELEIKNAVDELNDWAMRSQAPITIRLCSPGGTVFDGLFFYDFIHDLRRAGIMVTTYTLGYAASMASVISQAGDIRRISRNSWFMVHEPTSISLGKTSELKDEAKLMTRIHAQMVGIMAARSNLTYKQVLLRCNRKDWWMSAEEATKLGFFDELV